MARSSILRWRTSTASSSSRTSTTPRTRAKIWTIRKCAASVFALKCQKAAKTSTAISSGPGAFAIAPSRARHLPLAAASDPSHPAVNGADPVAVNEAVVAVNGVVVAAVVARDPVLGAVVAVVAAVAVVVAIATTWVELIAFNRLTCSIKGGRRTFYDKPAYKKYGAPTKSKWSVEVDNLSSRCR